MFSDFERLSDNAPDALTLALLPDPPTALALASAAAEFAGAYRLAGRQARADQLALTLFEIGRYAGLPYGIVRQAQEAARRIAPARPFELVFDRVEAVRRPGGHWLATLAGPQQPALSDLHRALAAALERSGLGRSVGSRWRAGVPFLGVTSPIPAMPIEPITWRPTELALIHGLVRDSRQIVLGRWPLT